MRTIRNLLLALIIVITLSSCNGVWVGSGYPAPYPVYYGSYYYPGVYGPYPYYYRPYYYPYYRGYYRGPYRGRYYRGPYRGRYYRGKAVYRGPKGRYYRRHSSSSQVKQANQKVEKQKIDNIAKKSEGSSNKT